MSAGVRAEVKARGTGSAPVREIADLRDNEVKQQAYLALPCLALVRGCWARGEHAHAQNGFSIVILISLTRGQPRARERQNFEVVPAGVGKCRPSISVSSLRLWSTLSRYGCDAVMLRCIAGAGSREG